MRPRDDRGVSALELAIIAPSLLVLIFLIIQGALYFYARSVALQAARDGVSQLRLYQTYDGCTGAADAVASNVVQFAHAVGSGALTGTTVTPLCAKAQQYTNTAAPGSAPAANPASVSVSVTGASITLIPWGSFQVTETAKGTVEQFQDYG